MPKFGRGAVSALVCVLFLVGCNRNKASDPGAGPAAGSSPTTARPGYIVGKITRPDGSPVGIAGAKFTVTVNGVAGMGNEVSYSPQVDANGTFSLPVASGIYHQASAMIVVPFSGDFYTYQLVPTTMTGDTQSDAGIVSDFVWQISGPLWTCKDNPDPTNFTNWFGGCCTLQWDGVYRDASGALQSFKDATGGKIVFTATPKGKLIDGSDGKPLAWTCTWVPLGLTPTVLNDMPASSDGWHITGVETHPDGTTNPILFEANGSQQYAPAVDIQFKPTRGSPGFWPPPLMITRPAP